MRDRAHVSEVLFRGAHLDAVSEGLLGWTSFTVNELIRVDGVQVRRTRTGEIRLSYPVHADRAGVRHRIVRPLGRAVGGSILRQVLRALHLGVRAA